MQSSKRVVESAGSGISVPENWWEHKHHFRFGKDPTLNSDLLLKSVTVGFRKGNAVAQTKTALAA